MGDWDVVGTAPLGEWDVVSHAPADAAPADAEPADHGYSERRKLPLLQRAANPITSYWPTYKRMQNEAYNQAAEGLQQMTNPGPTTMAEGLGQDKLQNIYREKLGLPAQPSEKNGTGLYDVGAGALKAAAGGFNYLLGSPFNAAYRTIIGQPIEDATGIPREYPEFAAQLATPGLGFTKAGLPRAPGTVAETMPKIRTMEGPDLTSPEAEANRALAGKFDIDLTRGQATGDSDAIRREDMAARGAYGPEQQAAAEPKFKQQFQDIQDAGSSVGEQLNRGDRPTETVNDSGAALNKAIEKRAAKARSDRDEAEAAAESDAAAARAAVDARGQNIGDAIIAGRGEIEGQRGAGEIVNRDVRGAAAEDKAHYQAQYENVAREPGEFTPGTFEGVGSRIKNDLHFHEESPVEIDELTPAASKAIQALDEWSTPKITNHADPREPFADPQMAVTLKNVDTFMKRLSGFYKRAADDTDRRAVGRIMGEFGNQVEKAVSDGLFSGDPRALEMLKDAKASFRRYQQTYKPQQGDEVGTAMRRIVERNATPEETANMIVGSGTIGKAGLPVRLADRLEYVLGKDSDAWSAIRQAIWQKVSQVRGAGHNIDAARSSRNTLDFVDSTLARRMFSPEERGAMRAHAEGVRDLDAVIESLPSTRAAASAREGYQARFGGEGLTGSQRGVFQRIVDGTATPEETADVMFSIIGGGNSGNAVRAFRAIKNIVGRDKTAMGAIRQGVWQKLTQKPLGMDQLGQQKMVQSINQFLNGKGRTLARQLYSEQERALMGRYAEAVRKTIITKYARTNSDTAVAVAAQRHRAVAAAASAVTSLLHLGPIGHLGGHYVSKLLAKRFKSIGTEADLRSLNESIHDVIPPSPKQQQPRAPRTFRMAPIAAAIGNPKGPFGGSDNPYAP